MGLLYYKRNRHGFAMHKSLKNLPTSQWTRYIVATYLLYMWRICSTCSPLLCLHAHMYNYVLWVYYVIAMDWLYQCVGFVMNVSCVWLCVVVNVLCGRHAFVMHLLSDCYWFVEFVAIDLQLNPHMFALCLPKKSHEMQMVYYEFANQLHRVCYWIATKLLHN